MLRNGFSLVELSIVLVILGLLTGGILAGQSLIRASELRAVSTESQRYIAAVNTFRDKYFAVPGDFRDGTRFWGRQIAAADCVTNSATAVAAPGTCDGTGDGNVTGNAANLHAEAFHFWRQLALAGLIEGTYSGTAGAGGAIHMVIGTNIPASKFPSAGWGAGGMVVGGDGVTYAITYDHWLQLGGNHATGSNATAVLKPEEAWNIDTKTDDGRPAYGKVIAKYWNNACAAANDGTHANNDLDASYKLTDSTVQCSLVFNNAY